MFGHFATIVTLSRKSGQPYRYVSELPADEVYMTLLYDMEVAEYERRLREVVGKVVEG